MPLYDLVPGMTGSVSVDVNGDRKYDFNVEIYRQGFIRIGKYKSFLGNLSINQVGRFTTYVSDT